jgi:hypothetical protein
MRPCQERGLVFRRRAHEGDGNRRPATGGDGARLQSRLAPNAAGSNRHFTGTPQCFQWLGTLFSSALKKWGRFCPGVAWQSN